MRINDVLAYIRKNYFIIAVGLCAVVVLIFLSENFGTDESSKRLNGADFESKLEKFLTELEGVGECDVIIFTENKKETSFSSSETENILGIAVVCDGGGQVGVKNMLVDILTRLFGISSSRISVNKKT